MDNPRTDSARDHDDRALIDQMTDEADGGAVAGSAGGHLQSDIGSKADLTRAVADPEADTRPEKQDDIANNQAYPSGRGNNRQ